MMLSMRAGKVESIPTDVSGAETSAPTAGSRGGGGSGAGAEGAVWGWGDTRMGCLVQPDAAATAISAPSARPDAARADRWYRRAMFQSYKDAPRKWGIRQFARRVARLVRSRVL